MRATVWLDRKTRTWKLTVLHGCRVDTLTLWACADRVAAEAEANRILEANGLPVIAVAV